MLSTPQKMGRGYLTSVNLGSKTGTQTIQSSGLVDLSRKFNFVCSKPDTETSSVASESVKTMAMNF